MEACIEEGVTLPDEQKTSEKENAEEIFQLVESFYGNAGAIMYHNNMLQVRFQFCVVLDFNMYSFMMINQKNFSRTRISL